MPNGLSFQKCGPPLSPEQISVFEKRLGGQLPDDYKRLLLAHNGGFCEPMLSLMWKGEVEKFPYFDPLLPTTQRDGGGLWNNLLRLRRINAEEVDGYLPITGALSGRYICLAYQGTHAGGVFITDFEYKVVNRGDLIPDDVTMVPLADSFTDLLKLLVAIPRLYCQIEELGRCGTLDDLEQYLAEGHSIDAVSKNGLSILCESTKFDNRPMFEACLRHDAGLANSISIAVRNRRLELIPTLVSAGADINEPDESGLTPLDYVGGTAIPGNKGAENRRMKDLLLRLGARRKA